MELTRAERGRLALLADELALDNPRLARALAGRWYRLRPRRHRPGQRAGGRHTKVAGYLAMLLMLAAPPLLIVGVLLGQPLEVFLGALALLAGPAIVTTGLVRKRLGQRPGISPIPPRHREGRTS